MAKIALLKFGADWCQPCKQMKKTLETVLASKPDQFEIKEIDVEKDAALANAHAVRTLPTLICNGRRLVGSVSAHELKKWLEGCING